MSDTTVNMRTVTGKSLYYQIEKGITIYNGTSFVTLVLADWLQYAIAMTETPAGSGRYIGTFPSLTADYYSCSIYMQSDVSPASSDLCLGSSSSYWDGTQFLPSGPSQLGPNAFDAIIVEEATDTTPEINVLQAINLMMNAAPAGLITGINSPNPIKIYNPDGSILRVTIQADPKGNRSNVQFNNMP